MTVRKATIAGRKVRIRNGVIIKWVPRYRTVQAAAAYVALRTYTALVGIRLRGSPGP